MQSYPITEADLQLIELATETIQSRYSDDKHHVAAALRRKDGATKVGVHVEAYIRRVTVCAEAIMIGSAITDGLTDFETIVAVRHPYSDDADRTIRVVSPCGMCRKLISDYASDAFVPLMIDNQLTNVQISDFISMKYVRS
jgi:cytidine deaminase